MLKLFVIIGSLLFVGCSSVVKSVVKEPHVEFQEIKIINMNLETVDLEAVLTAENKNNFSLKFDEVHYDLIVKEKSVVNGVWNQIPNLEPMKKTDLKVPIKLPLSSIVDSAINLFTTKELPYEIKGKVKYGILTIPYQKKGIVKH